MLYTPTSNVDTSRVMLLPSQAPDRAYDQARGLQADAGRAGARGRAETEEKSANTLARCSGTRMKPC